MSHFLAPHGKFSRPFRFKCASAVLTGKWQIITEPFDIKRQKCPRVTMAVAANDVGVRGVLGSMGNKNVNEHLLILAFFCLGGLGFCGLEAPDGQLSGWFDIGEGSFSDSRLGIRYIPTFSWEHERDAGGKWDLEVALNAQSWGRLDDTFSNSDVKLYRGWLRYSSPKLEVRAGLQKLEFGPATLLRSLRWFDRIDPRDPLKLTEGVEGLLGRVHLKNNASFWLWGLKGEDEAKGLESVASEDDSLEIGGRFQHSIGEGELAYTYHHRREAPESGPREEQRYALDGKWDLVAGLWFEAVVSRRADVTGELNTQHFLTLGADYTLPLGNGLHVVAENLWLGLAESPLASGRDTNYSALALDTSSGLLNRFFAVFSYDWERQGLSTYLSWARVYDKWSFYLNAYDNPRTTQATMTSGETFGRGKGVQILVVFNH